VSGPAQIVVDTGGIRLAALDYGNPGAPPLVVLHGQGDLAWSMDSVAAALAPDFHVVSLDLRGHGHSERGAYTMPHFVGDLRGAIEALGLERPVLVGHSLGGQVVAQFAGLYPEVPRLIVLVEAIGPPTRARQDIGPTRRRLMDRQLVETVRTRPRRRPMPDAAAAADRLRQVHPGLDPERLERLVELGTTTAPEGGVEWRFDPSSRDWLASFDPTLAEERWQGIRCPVLVILGGDSWERFWKDRLPPFAGAELDGPMSTAERDRRLACFADVELTEIDGAGHMVHFDAPAELNDAIAGFLARRL